MRLPLSDCRSPSAVKVIDVPAVMPFGLAVIVLLPVSTVAAAAPTDCCTVKLTPAVNSSYTMVTVALYVPEVRLSCASTVKEAFCPSLRVPRLPPRQCESSGVGST